jgi:hypothetical protein
VKPYLEKTHHKKGLMELLKVALSSSPSAAKKKNERKNCPAKLYALLCIIIL